MGSLYLFTGKAGLAGCDCIFFPLVILDENPWDRWHKSSMEQVPVLPTQQQCQSTEGNSKNKGKSSIGLVLSLSTTRILRLGVEVCHVGLDQSMCVWLRVRLWKTWCSLSLLSNQNFTLIELIYVPWRNLSLTDDQCNFAGMSQYLAFNLTN